MKTLLARAVDCMPCLTICHRCGQPFLTVRGDEGFCLVHGTVYVGEEPLPYVSNRARHGSKHDKPAGTPQPGRGNTYGLDVVAGTRKRG